VEMMAEYCPRVALPPLIKPDRTGDNYSDRKEVRRDGKEPLEKLSDNLQVHCLREGPLPLQLLGQLHKLPCPLTASLAITGFRPSAVGPQLPPSWGCVSIHSRYSLWASVICSRVIQRSFKRSLFLRAVAFPWAAERLNHI